jgi:succinoglycan biosynthesis transport protein ExoP
MSELFKAMTPMNAGPSERAREGARPSPAAAWPGPSVSYTAAVETDLNLRQPPTHSEPPSGESVNLDELFHSLWRSKAALLAGAAVGTLAMLAVSSFSPPIYRARTAIRLEELNQSPDLASALSGAGNSGENYLQNEMKTLESDTLAKRVAIQLGLQPPPRRESFLSRVFSSTPLAHVLARVTGGRRPASIDDFRINAVHRALTVRSSLKSQVLEVFFDSPDPAVAAKGANALVSQYIGMNMEGQRQASRDTTVWLAAEITDLKTKLDGGNAQLQAFAHSSGLLYGANQSLLSEERARQVQEELSKAHADRAAAESRYEAAISNSPEALPAGPESTLLHQYEGELATVQGELTKLRGLYTPAHYKVVEAEARAAQLEASIKRERERIISRIRAQYDAARRFEESLSGTYNADTRELTKQTSDAFHYNVLKRDLESTEQLYNSLLQKAKEAGITSGMHATSVRVIDSASPPSMPYSPNLPVNGAIGFSSGLILAVGIVLVRNRDAYVGDQSAGAQSVTVRELGAIPFARRNRQRRWRNGLLTAEPKKASVEMVTWYEQPAMVSEAFRATLASILFSPVFDQRSHLVMTVTSARPQEGKTTTVCNLGIALAETRGRVLLIDADLRRPRIHEIFGNCNDSGLTTVLTGEEPVATLNLDTLIRPTSVPGLFTLPSGPGAPSITPLLFSARMAAFLARMKKEFDFVLLDTPPAGLFSDARIIGRHSDGLIMVIHATKITRGELNSVCTDFLKDGTRIVGTIVNRSPVRKRGYEYYKRPKTV